MIPQLSVILVYNEYDVIILLLLQDWFFLQICMKWWFAFLWPFPVFIFCISHVIGLLHDVAKQFLVAKSCEHQPWPSHSFSRSISFDSFKTTTYFLKLRRDSIFLVDYHLLWCKMWIVHQTILMHLIRKEPEIVEKINANI